MSRREQKSWSWISRRVRPGMTVLAKASNNLTDRPTKGPSIFIRHKRILSSERMLHKDYGRKSSVVKEKTLIVILKEFGAQTK
jgi:hypothetical protein